jgi:hypothetical protein
MAAELFPLLIALLALLALDLGATSPNRGRTQRSKARRTQ